MPMMKGRFPVGCARGYGISLMIFIVSTDTGTNFPQQLNHRFFVTRQNLFQRKVLEFRVRVVNGTLTKSGTC